MVPATMSEVPRQSTIAVQIATTMLTTGDISALILRAWRAAFTVARLAARLGRIDQATVERQDALLEHLGLALDPPEVDAQELLRVMHRDKKASAGKLRMGNHERAGTMPSAAPQQNVEIEHTRGPSPAPAAAEFPLDGL